jgi:DNA-binding IclR family transcriptional regulator
MERVREYGVAVNSRVIEGIRAIAAPVFNEHGEIAATLALVGTVAAIPAAPDSGLARALKDVALEFSTGLGYVPRQA